MQARNFCLRYFFPLSFLRITRGYFSFPARLARSMRAGIAFIASELASALESLVRQHETNRA